MYLDPVAFVFSGSSILLYQLLPDEPRSLEALHTHEALYEILVQFLVYVRADVTVFEMILQVLHTRQEVGIGIDVGQPHHSLVLLGEGHHVVFSYEPWFHGVFMGLAVVDFSQCVVDPYAGLQLREWLVYDHPCKISQCGLT